MQCVYYHYRLYNFKNKIIARLRQVIMKEGSNYESVKNENPYNVPYRPQAASVVKSDWICDMASNMEKFRTLEKTDIDHLLTKKIPEVPLFKDDEVFSTCAIISNAATLRNSNLGYFIGDKPNQTVRVYTRLYYAFPFKPVYLVRSKLFVDS